jgi:iron(III) transport system substrate-binding protein
MLSAFEKEYEALHPDQDVRWLDMGSQDALDRIRSERQNPQADVWWGGPMTMFSKASAEGLLELYIPTWDSAVGSGFKSREGTWYGTFITPDVIVYNNALLRPEEAPQDWDDLLDRRWKGKIVIRSPLASGTMRTVICCLIQRQVEQRGDVDAGLAWLRRLDANTKAYAADPTQLYLKIARQEGAVTLWDLPDILMQVQVNGYPFGYILPASGTPLITDAIALLHGSKHPAEARQFYEFVTSRESMLRQAKDFYRIPTRNDLPGKDLPSWLRGLDLRPFPVNFDTLAAHEQEWMRRWDDEVRGKGESEPFGQQ